MTYLGLDLTTSEKKASAYAVLDDSGSLTNCGKLHTDAEIREWALSQSAAALGIDCPLGLPAGLDCLEEDCPRESCITRSTRKGREAERELARRGISCYFTTKRSIIKAMVYRGMALSEDLSAKGLEVAEVYPYASKRFLWGKPIPKKTSRSGRNYMQEHLGPLVPGVASRAGKLTHDHFDAIVAAYTAYLHGRGETERLGNEEEAFIVVPKAN